MSATTWSGLLLILTPLIHGAPEAAQRGMVKVHDHCSVALDGGKVECVVTLDGDRTEPKQHPGGKGWDFWFEVSGKALFLHSQNRTLFANAGTADNGKSSCQAAAYKRDRFRIDTLPPGFHVCILTGQRRYAALTLVSTAKPQSEPLQLTYILWE